MQISRRYGAEQTQTRRKGRKKSLFDGNHSTVKANFERKKKKKKI